MCTVLKEETRAKEETKVAITSLCMLVADGVCTALWGPKRMHGASEIWMCSMTFCMARMKRNHQRQVKARQGKAGHFFHGFWSLFPQHCESETPSGSWGPVTVKSEALRGAEPQWHTHAEEVLTERPPASSVEHSCKLSKPLFLAGAQHFHYLGFGPNWARVLLFKTQQPKLLRAIFC